MTTNKIDLAKLSDRELKEELSRRESTKKLAWKKRYATIEVLLGGYLVEVFADKIYDEIYSKLSKEEIGSADKRISKLSEKLAEKIGEVELRLSLDLDKEKIHTMGLYVNGEKW